ALTCAALCSLEPARAAAPTTVGVTITDASVRLSRTSSGTGTTMFEVTNRGKRRHQFRIGGKTTPALPPGHSATPTILFQQPGKYRYLVPGLATRVVHATLYPAAVPPATTTTSTFTAQPCINPTTSTVTVTMTDATAQHGNTFAPSTVSCGTVTFILKDLGTA